MTLLCQRGCRVSEDCEEGEPSSGQLSITIRSAFHSAAQDPPDAASVYLGWRCTSRNGPIRWQQFAPVISALALFLAAPHDLRCCIGPEPQLRELFHGHERLDGFIECNEHDGLAFGPNTQDRSKAPKHQAVKWIPVLVNDAMVEEESEPMSVRS